MSEEKKNAAAQEEEIIAEAAENEQTEEKTEQPEVKPKKEKKKADKKEEKTAALEEEKAQYLEMLRRERADFENYKKRNASLSATAYANGAFDTVEKLLPVMDNFERAMSVCDEKDPFVKGIVMIQKQMGEALKALGLTEIEAEGKPFDPELMNAVMQVECKEGQEQNCVAEVLQKGYALNGKVLRHAVVKVTK